jgi:hypothetical protein
VEVIDAYCRTLILASQLSGPIRRIPKDKISALLEIKKKLGLPDSRFRSRKLEGVLHSVKGNHRGGVTIPANLRKKRELAFEALVSRIADQVLEFSSSE